MKHTSKSVDMGAAQAALHAARKDYNAKIRAHIRATSALSEAKARLVNAEEAFRAASDAIALGSD